MTCLIAPSCNMFSKLLFGIISTVLLLHVAVEGNCFDLKTRFNFRFYLWKSKQRSLKERLFVDNVDSLKACKELARKFRGLALNYSPRKKFIELRGDRISFRDHYWHQPHLYFNCHILQCPESNAFETMANDTSFDYFSLYEKPMASTDYTCLPEVGIFMLNTIPETYHNATLKCRHSQNYCGTLAHIASQKRTEALTRLIVHYNEENASQNMPPVYLAYIGLQHNFTMSHKYEFFNDDMEDLKCFNYRAWEPGNPKMSSVYTNSSCVALTVNRSWRTVKCDRKLPFICEIWTTCSNERVQVA